MGKLTKDLIEKLKVMDTTCVSDALDRLEIKGGCEGILPIVRGVKAVGPAFTVKYRPCGVEKGTVGDFLDDVQPGQVVAIDNGGRTHVTVWGDIMTFYAQRRGLAGTVIDGVCRDVPQIIESKYPIYTRGRFMVTGKGRVEVEGVNVPISIGGVQVKPDDIMLCDDTGVVVIPAGEAEDVLTVAIEINKAEEKILELLEMGLTLREARMQVGYHKLSQKR